MRVDDFLISGWIVERPSPSGTPSNSASSSTTASPSKTASQSVTVTSSSSASPSFGATSSSSSTATLSTTATSTGTSSNTGSVTATPTPWPLMTGFTSTIAAYTFEGSSYAASEGLNAASSGTVTIVGGVTPSWVNATSGAALSLVNFPGQGAGNASAGVQWCVDSNGFIPALVSFDARSSNTNSKWRTLQYRTGAALAWRDVAGFAAVTAGANFDSYSASLPFDYYAVNNLGSLCFRLVTCFEPGVRTYISAQTGGTYSSGGTLRVDSIRVEGWQTAPATPSTTATSTASASGTASSTASVSVTASASTTASNTGSPEPTATNTLSPGATASGTGSTTASSTGSGTPSATATSPATPSVTPIATPVVLAEWSFDAANSMLAPSGGVNAAASSNVSVIGGVTTTTVTGTSGNALSLTSFPSPSTGNGTAGIQFCVSTLQLAPVSISLAIRTSNSGAAHKVLQVRTYTGGPWADLALMTATTANAGAAFDSYAISLASAVAAGDGMWQVSGRAFCVVRVYLALSLRPNQIRSFNPPPPPPSLDSITPFPAVQSGALLPRGGRLRAQQHQLHWRQWRVLRLRWDDAV